MRTAKEIKINYHTKAAYELASSLPCPKSANDVYSLGVSLQYCIRAKYLELAGQNIGKDFLIDQAAQQLAIKNKMEELAAFKLNVLLGKFYDQGGPIIEDPVSKQMVKEIQPFFNRIISLFLQSLDEITYQAVTQNMGVQEMVSEVIRQINETYNALGKMFPVKEIEGAFADLLDIIPS
jgi:hypothetical protein